MEGFLEPGPEGPICMVNLLKFKTRAEYEDGRETQFTGEEAYGLCAKGVEQLLLSSGFRCEHGTRATGPTKR